MDNRGDNDGAHISDLLLLVFLKMFPGLVEAGKVFKAVPPLYGIPRGKKMEYFSQRIDFVRYMQKEFYKSNEVTDHKGKKIDPSVFSRILIENSDYVYDFKSIKDRYTLNPDLLEMVIISHIKNEKFETLRKRITTRFRFMNNENVQKISNGIKISGLVDGEVETLFYNKRFIEECNLLIEPLKKAISDNHTLFLVNGKPMGLYELVSTAMDMNMKVSRYKGLGEMNFNQLKESTMDPNTRTLIQYTVNDINETMKIIRQYDSNKKLILKQVGIVKRDDLIGL